MTTAPTERISVTILTGFLGSGKTTALDHLVRQRELAGALVIINEFGEMALDHRLVAHSTENLLTQMSSGCLCCTLRGDLVKTLRDITWRFSRNGDRQFDRVLIETTGLADPAPIVHTLATHPAIVSTYALDGIVTTVDLATGAETLDRHVEAVKQAALADALLLTKADVATDEQRSAVLSRLDGLNPAAPRWEVRNGQVAPASVLDLGVFSIAGKQPDVERWLAEEAYAQAAPSPATDAAYGHDLPHGREQPDEHVYEHEHEHDVNRHDDRIRAFCFAVQEPIPEAALTVWLELLMRLAGPDMLRIKAVLNVEGYDHPIALHGVQHIFHPPVHLPAWTSEDRRSRLVFITRDVGRDVIEATFRAVRDMAPEAGGAS